MSDKSRKKDPNETDGWESMMTEMQDPFADDNFAKYVGIELLESSKGFARAKLTITPNHLNGLGTLHGGAIFSLAVWTFAVAANTDQPLSVGVNATISFTKAIAEGVVTAEAREITTGRRLAHYNVKVTDESDNVVAAFQGMAYKK